MPRIQALFCVPPIVFARLGASSAPMAAYSWTAPVNPRTDGDTVAHPEVSLDVSADGHVEPLPPGPLKFKDAGLIRPVCPFVEVWARIGEAGEPDQWIEAPLTMGLLAADGASMADLKFTITARNLKAARRAGKPALAHGTFPPVEISGDDHAAKSLNGVNPPGTAKPMIPAGKSIPLGRLQVLRPAAQPGPDKAVDLAVVRLRFTPAAGRFYGPPQAAVPTAESPTPAVPTENAFLDPAAGWFNSQGGASDFIAPGDTFDETAPDSGLALGVVDDTCEARIDVRLTLPGGRLFDTHATVFSGPPDFAPDRRPFLSIADELNDRSGDAAARNATVIAKDLDLWVEDLFERIYETACLFNLDFWRVQRGKTLSGSELVSPIPKDNVSPPTLAMGSRDSLRDGNKTVEAPTPSEPLPLSLRARDRHGTLSDLQNLRNLVLGKPDRLRALVRGAFEVEPGEERGGSTTMRMPPFMRQSNFRPLTLSGWQYDLLMRWVDETLAPPEPPGAPLALQVEEISAPAAERRAAVLESLGGVGP